MASEAESFTIGCMVRVYHIYKDVWLSYTVIEMLYHLHDEISAEWPFGSGSTAAKQKYIHSFKA